MGLFDWLRDTFGPGPGKDKPPADRPPQPPVPPKAAAPPRTTPPGRPRAAQSTPVASLDASRFTPLADAEVRRQAQDVGPAWQSPGFGRRDLIPPVGDPRTDLIDRALVGHGLITPDELTEIHSAGAEMDAVRPDLAVAAQLGAQAGERAVARSRAERQALKEKKRAEAAERRRRHAEEVARRRTTDIVFLGRGVSRGLADRRANVEKLQRAGLPVLAAPADVAQALGLEIPRLRWLAFHAEAAARTHYVRFTVPKKSGGTRELAAPHKKLAARQSWILREILAKLPVSAAAHGFIPGRNTLTNAGPHVGRAVVVNADLKDFFPSITFPRVAGAFVALGYSPAAATILALLCTESPRREVVLAGKRWHVATGPRALPQGACTSPALSNLVSRRLDARLGGLAAKLGWAYTRYADDLTFSAPDPAADARTGYLLARVRHIAQGEGFVVNEKKTRVQRPNTAQVVTGIVVNRRAGVRRRLVRRIRAILHRARGAGGLAAQARGRPRFEAWLRGMIAYIGGINADQGARLRAALDEVR